MNTIREAKLKSLLIIVGVDPRPDAIFDREELEAGTKVEFEHTMNLQIAKKIAKDHLEENPRYYKLLKTLGL